MGPSSEGGSQLDPQRPANFLNGVKPRMGLRTQCFVQSFPSQSGRLSHLCHAARAGHITQSGCEQSGIAVFNGQTNVVGYRLVVGEVLRGVEFSKLGNPDLLRHVIITNGLDITQLPQTRLSDSKHETAPSRWVTETVEPALECFCQDDFQHMSNVIERSQVRKHFLDPRLLLSTLLSTVLLQLGSTALAAESLAGSSAAGGSSASSAASSASDSASASSNSSTKLVTDARGPYRVVMITPALDDGRFVRVTLEQGQASNTLQLRLPRVVAERAELMLGATVMATPRPYGVQFSRADQTEPFFLVIRDDVHREFAQTPVRL